MVKTSLFDHVTLAPPDPIFGLVKAFQSDPRSHKVNLLIGFYKTEEGQTPLLECVKKAEHLILQKEQHKEYLPIDGNPVFIEKIGKLIFGQTLWDESKETIYGAQTIGGTGALRILGDFLKRELASEIWVSDPTWANHRNIFTHAGLIIQKYPYYDRKRQRLVYDEMVGYLSKLPPRSVILLHCNCHNPTGFDLSLQQWKELSALFLKNELFPFFDVAYQGFGQGLEEDLAGVRYFVEQGHEMAIAYSCAKNFSLYGERAGALYLVDGCPKNRENIESQIKTTIRANYSNPPIHAASIVAEILSSSQLTEEWKKDLEQMRLRIVKMRKMFIAALLEKQIPYDVEFMKHSRGLFCYSGLEKHHVDVLIANYGIYLPSDGRVNVTGLNQSNLEYIINAIVEVVNG